MIGLLIMSLPGPIFQSEASPFREYDLGTSASSLINFMLINLPISLIFVALIDLLSTVWIRYVCTLHPLSMGRTRVCWN